MAVPTDGKKSTTLREFVMAWEAGEYGKRAELLDGVVRHMPIGDWHAETTVNVIRALPDGSYRISAGSLASGESLPGPDCFVRRRGARPIEQLSPRMSRWPAEDVVLVVEVSEETIDYNLGRKADIYAEVGFTHYWVVTPAGVYAHNEPHAGRYVERRLHKPGERITVPYAPAVELGVEDLISQAG
ncbi:Uma2 family endonuclease [Pseudonocardia sp. CA-107938]|uniref:Uma2 family endonuclease n=1 Tax=Pseudonocardia sp. CA-107938 TaxID=3240021 RepID=UPI003D90E1AF